MDHPGGTVSQTFRLYNVLFWILIVFGFRVEFRVAHKHRRIASHRGSGRGTTSKMILQTRRMDHEMGVDGTERPEFSKLPAMLNPQNLPRKLEPYNATQRPITPRYA